MLLYDIPAEFGTEFEAAEKFSHASLMMYYNDIQRDMAAIFSCMNGFVFHSLKSFVLPDKQYNSCWSQLVFIKALIIRRSRSFSFLQDLSVWAHNHMFLCKLQRRHYCHKTSLRLALVCHWVYRENPVLRVPRS